MCVYIYIYIYTHIIYTHTHTYIWPPGAREDVADVFDRVEVNIRELATLCVLLVCTIKVGMCYYVSL